MLTAVGGGGATPLCRGRRPSRLRGAVRGGVAIDRHIDEPRRRDTATFPFGHEILHSATGRAQPGTTLRNPNPPPPAAAAS